MRFIHQSRSADDTQALGAALGRLAEPGLVVGLAGRLGAGKTVFVRGLAEGLLIDDSRVVSSPTYVLIHEYEARLPIYHFDTYRLPSDGAFAELGTWEYFDGEGVSVVEWSDRVAAFLPPDRLELLIEDQGLSARQITARLWGTRWKKLFEAWAGAVDARLFAD